jgi:PAS domain S-box-containing protein
MDGRRAFELNLLDQVPLAMVILALDGTIGYWNKGAEALYGWPRRDVMRRPFEALGASGRAVEAVREALEAVASGGVWAGRVAIQHHRGSVTAADIRCSPLQNAEHETIGAIVVAVETGASTASEDAHVGRRIARARKEAGLTQEDLAVRVGVTRRSIQGWEAGSIAPYRHLDRLAAALGRRVADLRQAAGRAPPLGELLAALEAAHRAAGLVPVPGALSEGERRRAGRLVAEKYALASWTSRR